DGADMDVTDVEVAVRAEDHFAGVSKSAAGGRDELVQEGAGLAVEALDRSLIVAAVSDVEVAVRAEQDAAGAFEVLAGEHAQECPGRAVVLQHGGVGGLLV